MKESSLATCDTSGRARADRLTADFLVALVSVSLLAGAAFLTADLFRGEGQRLGPERIRAQEHTAFENLRAIAKAQEIYRASDPDGDDIHSYAAFHIHLWQSVRTDGSKTSVDLISRDLAFAMVDAFALEGYVFVSLHKKMAFPDGMERNVALKNAEHAQPLDPTEEWAVAALPAAAEESGRIFYIADETGIWATADSDRWLGVRPVRPSDEGWTRVDTIADVKGLQSSL